MEFDVHHFWLRIFRLPPVSFSTLSLFPPCLSPNHYEPRTSTLLQLYTITRTTCATANAWRYVDNDDHPLRDVRNESKPTDCLGNESSRNSRRPADSAIDIYRCIGAASGRIEIRNRRYVSSGPWIRDHRHSLVPVWSSVASQRITCHVHSRQVLPWFAFSGIDGKKMPIWT